jgi:hypothetical protein
MEASFTRTTLRMFCGVIIWAMHFGLIYGYTALACARGFADTKWLGVSVVTAVIVGATVLAVGLVLASVVPAIRAGLGSFENWITAGTGAFALLAIAWEGFVPVFIVPICA